MNNEHIWRDDEFESDSFNGGHRDRDADESPQGGGWGNPPYAVRVTLVAAMLAGPGVLLGLMACLFIPFTSEPTAAAVAGGFLGAVVGAWMEGTNGN